MGKLTTKDIRSCFKYGTIIFDKQSITVRCPYITDMVEQAFSGKDLDILRSLFNKSTHVRFSFGKDLETMVEFMADFGIQTPVIYQPMEQPAELPDPNDIPYDPSNDRVLNAVSEDEFRKLQMKYGDDAGLMVVRQIIESEEREHESDPISFTKEVAFRRLDSLAKKLVSQGFKADVTSEKPDFITDGFIDFEFTSGSGIPQSYTGEILDTIREIIRACSQVSVEFEASEDNFIITLYA